MVTAFTAIMGLLVVAFSGSTLDRTLRYPRPVIDHSVAATHLQRPLFMLATKEAAPALAKNTPASDVKASEPGAVANTDTEKTKRERPPHPHKVAVRRQNFAGRDYTIAQGFSTGFGYRPGLDSQR
jgi:hypothetical protein